MAQASAADLLIIAGVGVAAYLIYQAVTATEEAASNVASAVGEATTAAASAVAAPIAAAYVWATSGSSVQPSGTVILPNGTAIPIAAAQNVVFNEAAGTAGAAQFTYQGVNYEILANPSGGPAYDTSGNYHAEQI